MAGATGTVAGVALSQLFAKPPQAVTVTCTLDEKFKQDLIDAISKAVANAVAKMAVATGIAMPAIMFKELLQVLEEENLIKSKRLVRTLQLQPGQVAVIEERVPTGKIYVFYAEKIETSPEYANAMYMYVDSEVSRFSDTAMVQSRYASLINYLDLGILVKAERFLRIEVTNTSQSESVFSYMLVYGEFDSEIWGIVSNKYFKAVREALGV